MATIAPVAAGQPRRIFASLALAAAVLALVVIAASAFIRHSQAGLSCADWPACYASAAAPDAGVVPSAAVRAVRATHRFAATGVAALLLGMLLVAWTQRPVWWREGAAATTAALIAAGLAILGVFTTGARVPAVTLGNLLGGVALVAALSAAQAVATPAPAASRAARGWARAALVLAFVQAGLGGLIGAQFATLSCGGVASCGAWTWSGFVAGGAWNPLQVPTLAGGHALPLAGAAALHVLHRSMGLALIATVLVTLHSLWRTHPRLALALLAVLGATGGAGIIAIAVQPTLAVVVIHNACAALLMALLIRAGLRSSAPARA